MSRASNVRRPTGPDFWTRELIRLRFAGRCCRCGKDGWTIQHRTPRALGGTKDPAINAPSNLLWVCGDGTRGCHGHMESHRTESYEKGWLVRHGTSPETVAVHLWDGRRVLLDNTGNWSHAGSPPTSLRLS
jgi:hypothetical protein